MPSGRALSRSAYSATIWFLDLQRIRRLAGEVGLRCWQSAVEVGDRLALTLDGPGLDLHRQDVARPAVFDRCGVPQPDVVVLELGQQHDVVALRHLSNSLLDKCLFRPRLGERAHVHEVRPGEAAQVREHLAQVMGQALDHLAAPPLLGLAVEDVPVDLPVEPGQFGVHRQRGTLLGRVDATFEVGQLAGGR